MIKGERHKTIGNSYDEFGVVAQHAKCQTLATFLLEALVEDPFPPGYRTLRGERCMSPIGYE